MLSRWLARPREHRARAPRRHTRSLLLYVCPQVHARFDTDFGLDDIGLWPANCGATGDHLERSDTVDDFTSRGVASLAGEYISHGDESGPNGLTRSETPSYTLPGHPYARRGSLTSPGVGEGGEVSDTKCSEASHARGTVITEPTESSYPYGSIMPAMLPTDAPVTPSAPKDDVQAAVTYVPGSHRPESRSVSCGEIAAPNRTDAVSLIASSDVFGPSSRPIIVAAQQHVPISTLTHLEQGSTGARPRRAQDVLGVVKHLWQRAHVGGKRQAHGG